MKSICIVLTWFGQWPFWIEFFLASCKENKTINWIIITDCSTPENAPKNVEFISMTLDELNRHISSTLNITFELDNAYKLCDIKPLLGHLFEDSIASYDFFGFGDTDVIYGDLRSLYTEKKLRYNCISNHATRISGHLCLMKNTKEMRLAYQNIKNWQEIISDKQHRAFDEKHFSKLFLKHKNFPLWLSNTLRFFYYFPRTSYFHESFSTPDMRIPWKKGDKNFPSEWYWNNGSLTNNIDNSDTFPYLHFMYWKSEVWPKVGNNNELMRGTPSNSKSWKISKSGFTTE